ncbi:MAG TPA: 2-oxo acid dehydrogenase subunit E2 [Labilithrix sp.]|nr:2-oxo acid dehydrogenase subunit E2 [Labilithrix sp.]
MRPHFVPDPSPATFRRIAASLWRRPSDPSIHGSMDLDATAVLRLVSTFRERTGHRLTVTHVVASAVAHAFARHPELNAKVRFGGRIERRESVDLFVSVAADGGKDLSGVRIEGADALDLDDLVAAVERGARRVRTGADDEYQRGRDLLRSIPWWLLGPALRATDLLTNEAHVHRPDLGMPCDPFGTAIVSNVGTFGVDTAFAPFLPLGRCAMLMLIGEVKVRPWVVGERIEPRPVLRLCATFDHRIIDGHGAGLVARAIRERIDQLARAFDAAPHAAAPARPLHA